MSSGVVYGVGIGPGDPDLITVKAVEIIKKEKNIFIPDSEKRENSLIKTVIQRYLNSETQNKNIVEIKYFNMVNVKQRKWEFIAKKINSVILRGENVVYLTLGDPMVYGTFIYLIEELRKINLKVDIITIPGISSYSLGCSIFNIPLVSGREVATICCGGLAEEKLRIILKNSDTIVIMKIGKKIKKIINLLRQENLLKQSYLLKRMGFEDEYKVKNLESLKVSNLADDFGNLSTIIIRKDS